MTPSQRKVLLEDAWKNGGLAMLGTFADLLINPVANEHVAEFVRGRIGEVVKDPVIAEKLKPKGYPIFARRPCPDTSYYETYNHPNVHLVDCLEDPILEITEKGMRTPSGEIELDMLILATGPNGPAALATIVRISENDVDGYTELIGHMLKDGLAAQDGYRNFTFAPVTEALAD